MIVQHPPDPDVVAIRNGSGGVALRRLRPAEDFADHLRRSRRRARLTQAHAAGLAGINLRQYCKWESGECLPRLDSLVRLVVAVGDPTLIATYSDDRGARRARR